MALYRFEAKVISRSGGRSSVASAAYQTGKCSTSAAAYRAAVKLKDERTGQQYDYSRKLGVEGAEIIAPESAPAWMRDREQLWNAVEKVEKRKDAQLARDFIISLPHELDLRQRAEVIRDFVREQFTARGYVADIAWHLPDKKGGLNFHAHVMLPMRKLEGDGFARTKERPPEGQHPAKAWNEELGRLREAWANTANRHLEAAGLDVRIDHRSLAARGIDREPEPKQGPLATQIEQQGRRSLAGDERRATQGRNAERARLQGELAAVVGEEALVPPTQPDNSKDRQARVPVGDPSLEWTDRAGMVAQQESALKAMRALEQRTVARPENRAEEPKPAESFGGQEQTDKRAVRVARLQRMFEPKPEGRKEDGQDFDHTPGRGGGRDGRTR
jgi:ATP-dependent exoDNAse (exonuclease V) alpha subunit